MWKNASINIPNLIATVLTSLYFLFCITHPDFGHFVDNIDLVIHEAGHTILSFLGEFIMTLGGSFLQIFIPTVFSFYFFLQKEYFSASLILIWVGYNITNVSVYMNDAMAMSLPLLGGDGVIHDWNWILSTTHLLKYTHTLAHFTFGIGLLVVVTGIVLCFNFCIIAKTLLIKSDTL